MLDPAVDKAALPGPEPVLPVLRPEQHLSLRHQQELHLLVPVPDAAVVRVRHHLPVHGHGKIPCPVLRQLLKRLIHHDGPAFHPAASPQIDDRFDYTT